MPVRLNRDALLAVSSDMAVNLDALRPGFTDDPYSVLKSLREAGPVHRVEASGVPMWLVTRYPDVRAALDNPLLSSHGSALAEPLRGHPHFASWWFGDLSDHMMNSDAPDHTRLRRAVSSELTTRRIAALRPQVEALAASLADAFADAGRCDLIADFAAPLPIIVLMELLGVPAVDQENFRYWADVVTGLADGDASSAREEASGYLQDLVAHKRTSGDDDLIGALARATGEAALTDRELASLAFLLLVAGYTTAVDLVGNGTLALLRHPEQLELLQRSSSLLPGAIEEFLRFDGPTSHLIRFAARPVTIGGVQIPAGDVVLLSLASAEHDSARYPRADQLNIERADRQHLAFGHGIHFCLGAPLARLEGEVAFRTLLSRCAGLTLDVTQPLGWRVSLGSRGLRTLPVTFRTKPAMPLDEQMTVKVQKPM
ncbi:cytochrome P450 family protein [Lentzea nigeriaca]|uniref:cytochrome P450 family protein n=1 Tax=Lentzea nigeriaca TaxID=1128665 RepID=UPI00195C4665|nr:cytochrome P450 [Lentzea nigeriaca]MBM7859948.1 cytochrome P450 [Lentzea nigeriaca]